MNKRVIIAIVLFLAMIGLLMINSSSYNSKNYDSLTVIKQTAFLTVGIMAIFIMSKINLGYIKKYSYVLYIAINILLILVLFTPRINGASSWFDLGFMSIQPSEFAKIIIILLLAKELESIGKFSYIKSLALISIPTLLIVIQPDFGTAFIIMGIYFSMLFFSGIKYRYIITVVLIGVVTVGFIGYNILNDNNLFFSDYQANRIKTFLNPNFDPYGRGYNVLKAKQSIGSGKLLGMGYFRGLQTHIGNIPEKTTDFIFAVIGEELGFVSCSVIVVLFSTLFILCLKLAKSKKDAYSRLVVIGIFTMLFIHSTINIGMNIGLLPVTGIPLPFISYGGSSLLTNLIAVGIIMYI